MGHGSRVPGAANGMEKVAQALTQSGAYHMVETCYMSRLGPHFPETVEKCVTGGAKVVSLIPYFLHMGLHTRLDIPEMMKTEAARYPGVKIIFGECIGFDELMIEIVKKRVEASWKLADVRDMVLEPREKFPLPPGDLEFVPMTPEMAEKFREGGRCGHDHHH
ncbi:MAG: CbiX/SirB N-terminal domain-containing protein [Nitrospinae bacterium]|nr:CbiX/SirB N-terminal domain-containing protein [Nitrospinota bacterium]